jgi:metal-responsive CopG/Arc/MetJ family transcriptional regulator
MTTQVGKLTISLPKNLISFADKIASEKNISRSKVIAVCLREMADKRMIAEMEEGYKAMAEENRLLAEQFLPIMAETWPRYGDKA